MKLIYRGFTLTELMVVIAFIGILAAVSIPDHRHGTDRSAWRPCHANNRVLLGGNELFSMDNPGSATYLMLGDPTKPDNLLFRKGYTRTLFPPYNKAAVCSYYFQKDASGTDTISCVLHGKPGR